MAGKGALRSIKNLAKGFSDVQIKVREATSNDPWGPSGTLMNEIAQLTFNEADFIEIMDMIDKRLNDKGKNWRHVFKALLLLDYCLHVGSENVVLYAKENVYVVKTLKEFQHLEENGKDVGANVRQKAKDISNLLTDENRLKEERRQRQGMRDRMANINDYLSESVRRINNGEEEEVANWDDENELKKALAESKRIAAAEELNRKQGDDDLELALQISQQEALEKEQKKREQLERENTQNLFSSASGFGNFPQQNSMPLNNPYQQPQLQLEWTNGAVVNPYAQQQQSNPYAAVTSLQAQMTGFPASSSNNNGMDFFSSSSTTTSSIQQQPQLQAQMTGFQQPIQQQQQFHSQNQFLQPQQQQQSVPFQSSMVTGNTNPFSQMSSSSFHQQQQQPIQPVQHDYTGLVFGTPQQQQPKIASPVFAATAASSTAPNFSFTANNTTGSVSSPAFTHSAPFHTTTTTTPFQHSPKPLQTTTTAAVSFENDGKYAKLNALLANKDDGMDTFGNQGNLRIPYGTGFAGSLKLTPTNNAAVAPDFGITATTNKNPFGAMTTDSPMLQAQQQQKSLLDLMQEQKAVQQQQQQLFF